jgi:hypothetical protein
MLGIVKKTLIEFPNLKPTDAKSKVYKAIILIFP